MIRRRAERPRIHRPDIVRIGEERAGHDRAGHMALDLRRQPLGGQQGRGLGIAEADGDALDGGVGIEGEPGGARLGNGDLGDEQLGAARHPQADDRAGPDTATHEAARQGTGHGIDLGIGQRDLARNHAGLVRVRRDRAGKNLGEELVADQVRATGADQDGVGQCRRNRQLSRLGRPHREFRIEFHHVADRPSASAAEPRSRTLPWSAIRPGIHIRPPKSGLHERADSVRPGGQLHIMSRV